MSVHPESDTDKGEIPQGFNPLWFSGILECSGSASFGASTKEATNGGKRVETRPFISIGDNDFDRLTRLQQVTNVGKIYEMGANWKWLVTGKPALKLMALTRNFLLRERATAEAFAEWAKYENGENKLIVVNRYRSQPEPKISISEYTDYIRANPQFLAGIVDSRGIITFHSKEGRANTHDWNWYTITIDTKYTNILEAIKNIHGGRVDRHHGYRWVGDVEESRKLVEVVKPYLRIRDQQAKEIWR